MIARRMSSRAVFDEDQRLRALQRELPTPEGVVLRLRLATFGERAAAVSIDLAIIVGALLLVLLIFALSPGLWLDDMALSLVILVSFAIRSFYFAFFELRWRGATPGKRSMGLRVIDREGGPLRTDAVMARNLLREVELFLPITLLFTVDFGDAAGWVTALALVWTGALALLPLVNRDRLRAGDMVAGTWVIAAPRHVLLPDIASRPAGLVAGRPAGEVAEYRFTERQLAVYGVYELQVLEDLLRRRGPDSDSVQRQVVDRIRRKIDWQPPDDRPVDPRRFLDAFYRAQRARLETDLTFNRHRKDKHDRRR
jgi:uncharacterized RDD family membrane protein YckC